MFLLANFLIYVLVYGFLLLSRLKPRYPAIQWCVFKQKNIFKFIIMMFDELATESYYALSCSSD